MIDCTDDPCHLKWLVLDNRQLLDYIGDGSCSDGTPFNATDTSGLENCPVNIFYCTDEHH